MKTFEKFLSSVPGVNTLKYCFPGVSLTMNSVEENDMTHIILADEFWLANSNGGTYHMFEGLSYKPDIKNCKQLIIVLIRKMNRVGYTILF